MALTDEQKAKLKALPAEDRKTLLDLLKADGDGDGDVMATLSKLTARQKKMLAHLKLNDEGDPVAPAPGPAPKKSLLEHALESLGL